MLFLRRSPTPAVVAFGSIVAVGAAFALAAPSCASSSDADSSDGSQAGSGGSGGITTTATGTGGATTSQGGSGGSGASTTSTGGAGQGGVSTGGAGHGNGGAGGGGAGAGGEGGASPVFCLGMADPSVFQSPCNPINQDCAPGASCAATNGGAVFSTCDAASCAGDVSSASAICKAGVDCTLHFNGVGFCGTCGPGATCDFTDDGSAGGQYYTCEAGSTCAVHVISSSGGRTVDCAAASSCAVDGSASGFTLVLCTAQCDVQFFGGFLEVCCPNVPPTQCANGKITCDPADC